MKRTTDPRSRARDLPDFLGSNQGDEPATPEEQAGDYDADEEFDDDDTHDDDSDDDVDDSEDDGDDYSEDDDGDDDDFDDYEPPRQQDPARRRSYRIALTPAGGGGLIAFGALLAVAGIVMACVASLQAAITASVAIEPQTIALAGIAVLALGIGHRRVGHLQQVVEKIETRREQAHDELRDSIAELLQGQTGTTTSSSDDGNQDDGQLQQALLSLQRVDNKINNLTKAIKMYGKPLMEIAGQGTEIASSVAQVKSLVEGGAEAAQKGMRRIEGKFDEIDTSVDLGDLGNLGAVPAQLEKLQASIAIVNERLADTEVRACLGRLEESTRSLGEELARVPRDASVREATDGLQQSLDQATAGLRTGIEQLRDGNLSDIEGSVRELQREIAGLATSVAQIQAVVKDGARAVPAPAAPVAATAPAAPAKAAPAAAAAAQQSAPAATETGDPNGDSYATGKHKSKGKNVLGAIAKLKQMKG